jgi:hypothetical protein
MKKSIQVEIEYQHEGTHSLIVRNIWDFMYEIETRTLYLTAHRKYYQDETGRWESDVKVLPQPGDNCEEKLAEALGLPNSYDREKILLIAKAKCLEHDFYMKFNDLGCIELKWWIQTQEEIV